MAEAAQPRRLDDPIPEKLDEIELDLDHWTHQLSGCSGGSESHYAIEARLKRLERAKERYLSRRVMPQDSEAMAWRVCLGYRETLRELGRALENVAPASGDMSLVRPVKQEFDRIHAEFPGLIPAFDTNSVSVSGLRLQIASALGRISNRLEEHIGTGASTEPDNSGRKGTIQVFISHSHADISIAEAFADLFRSAFNLDCEAIRCSSVPRYALEFGLDVPRQIRDEVLGASVLLGIVTESSRESAWVLFELGARWGASKSLIPVLKGNGDTVLLPHPIRDAHAVTCTFENVMKLVEEVSIMLAKPSARASTYVRQIRAVIEAAQAASDSPDQAAAEERLAKPPLLAGATNSVSGTGSDGVLLPDELCLRSSENDLRFCIRPCSHNKNVGLLYKIISDRIDGLEQVRIWVREARSLDARKSALRSNVLKSSVQVAIARSANSPAVKPECLQAGHESNESWFALVGKENRLTLGDSGGGPLIWPSGDPNTMRTWHLTVAVEAVTEAGKSLKPWEFAIAMDWVTETNILRAYVPRDVVGRI